MQIYKFYKREIRSNPHLNSHLESYFPDSCDPESASTTGYNLQGTAGRALSTQTGHCPAGQSASLLCYNSRNIVDPAYHPYYYAYYAPTETLSANMIVDSDIPTSAPTTAGETTASIEESPPSYEMALMCPRVSHHQYPNSGFIQAPIQVILPKDQCNEKLALSASHKSPSLTSLTPTSQVMAKNENQNKNDGNGENAPHSSSSLEECKSLNCGPKVVIPIG